jgi:ribosome-binding factor A
LSRIEKVSEFIKMELADIILRKVRDDRVGFVTITDVVISKDLRVAKIYCSTFGDEKSRQKTVNGLNQATGFIRHELSQRVTFKFVPELRFFSDDSLERGTRILSKLKEIEKQRETKNISENKKRNKKSK